MHLPFYLIHATDPACEGVGFRTSHFTYETDTDRDTTLDAAVEAVLDHDVYPLASVWLCNPGAASMTDVTVEVLEELEARCENEAQYAPYHVLPAMRAYGVRFREPLVHDDTDEEVEDHDPVYDRPSAWPQRRLRVVGGA